MDVRFGLFGFIGNDLLCGLLFGQLVLVPTVSLAQNCVLAVRACLKLEKMVRFVKVFLFVLIFIQDGYSINPMKEYKMKPEQFNIDYKELKIKTSDGASLNTWVMSSKSEDKKNHTFVIAGSDAGNMGFTLAYAAYLLNSGYDVITFDYRGFGESSNFKHNPNNLYHTEYIDDFHSVVSWVRTEINPEKIGVLAFSMGTLIATAGFEKSNYDVLVAEAFIKSPRKIVKRINKVKGKKINLPKSNKLYRQNLNKINIPILLFGTKEDKITILEDSKKIVSKKPNRKLVEFDGERLRAGYTLGMDNYLNEIDKFIN